MISISAQDLQRQVGETRMQAAREPVLVTSHGKPRCVILSVEEFALKEAGHQQGRGRSVRVFLKFLGVEPRRK